MRIVQDEVVEVWDGDNLIAVILPGARSVRVVSWSGPVTCTIESELPLLAEIRFGGKNDHNPAV
jgi:hypothetical protein